MLIAFEGPATSGKSTLIAAVERALRREGIQACDAGVRSRPDGLDASLKELMCRGELVLDPVEELLLYGARLAARTRAAVDLAREGHLVLLDRHAVSLAVVAGHARGLDAGLVSRVIAAATRDVRADATIFLDVSEEQWRARGGPERHARSAVSGVEFFRATRSGFRDAYAAAPPPKLWLDSTELEPAVRCAAALTLITRLRT